MCAVIVAAPANAGPSTDRATGAKVPPLYKKCDNLNKKYPHGLGRANARDKSKSADRVTNFKRSTRLYNIAIKHNSRLDADKDGVACEQH
jgi:Excalibur calcium-binding domain